MTAEDVKYNLDHMRDPKVLESRTRSSMEAIDKVETPEKYTVVIKTQYPYAPLIDNIGDAWAVISSAGDHRE